MVDRTTLQFDYDQAYGHTAFALNGKAEAIVIFGWLAKVRFAAKLVL